MRPDIKAKLQSAFQIAFDCAENEAEARKLFKSAEELGIKLQYLDDNFTGLQNLLP
jgi:hypothetical protein